MMRMPDNLKADLLHLRERARLSNPDDRRALDFLEKAIKAMCRHDEILQGKLPYRTHVDGQFDVYTFHHDLSSQTSIMWGCLDFLRRYTSLSHTEQRVLGELSCAVSCLEVVHRHAANNVAVALYGVDDCPSEMSRVSLLEKIFNIARHGWATDQSPAASLVYDEAELAALPEVCDRVWSSWRLVNSVETVLHNLVRNALMYSLTPRSATIRGIVAPDGTLAGLSVENRGFGIREEHLPRVFERGFRSADAMAAARGAGVGLFVSRRLIESHGGRLTVSSEEVDPGVRLTRATALFPVAPRCAPE